MNTTKNVLRALYRISRNRAIAQSEQLELLPAQIHDYVFHSQPLLKQHTVFWGAEIQVHCLTHCYLWLRLRLLNKKLTKKLMTEVLTAMRAAHGLTNSNPEQERKAVRQQYKELKKLGRLCLRDWLDYEIECSPRFGELPPLKLLFQANSTVPKKRISEKKHNRVLAAQFLRDKALKKDALFFESSSKSAASVLYHIPAFLIEKADNIGRKNEG